MSWYSLDQLRRYKAQHRARLKRKGLRRLHEVYLHPLDFPAVARYIDAKNARRFPEGERPPRLIQPKRPRGGVTVTEAVQRLRIGAHAVRARIARGLLQQLPVRGFHRSYYLSEASVRREEQRLLKGLDTRAAAKYISKHAKRVAPKTLVKWRYEGRGPAFSKDVNGRVRYSRAHLNRWIGNTQRPR